MHSFVACLVHYPEQDVLLDPVTWHQLGETAWELRNWVQRGVEKVLVSLRRWQKIEFQRLCSAILDLLSDDPQHKFTVLLRIVVAPGRDVSMVALIDGSNSLTEAFSSYLSSGYSGKLIDYPVFDLRLFKRCLQWTASSIFESLEDFSITESIMNRLKGAKAWSFRPALRKIILKNDPDMPHVVDIVAVIIRVWPLFVSYLKKTERKDDYDSLMVKSSSFCCLNTISVQCISYICCLEAGDGRFFLFGPACSPQVPFVPHAAQDLWSFAILDFGYVGVPD